MKHIISWRNYSFYVLIVLAFYYSVLLLKYYKSELRQWYDGLAGQKGNIIGVPMPERRVGRPSQNDEDDKMKFSGISEALINELHTFLLQSGQESAEKGRIIIGIAGILNKFPNVKGTEMEMGVRNFIVAETDVNCDLQLNDDDWAGVWNKI